MANIEETLKDKNTKNGNIFKDNIKSSLVCFVGSIPLFLLANSSINSAIKQLNLVLRIIVLLIPSISLISFIAFIGYASQLAKDYQTTKSAAKTLKLNNTTASSAFLEGLSMAIITLNPLQNSHKPAELELSDLSS